MIHALLPIIGSVLDRVLPDKKAAAEAKLKMMELAGQGELKFLESQAEIISAEAKSEHWLTATWRPICMLTFVAIIANNYILYPYLSLFWEQAPVLDIPGDMWDLLKIGLGGYVVGRSAEKFAKNWGKE